MDVYQLSCGRLSVPLWTSIRLHLDIHHLCGHPSAIKRTSARTSVTVHQLSYERPSVFKLTSVSFYIDVHHYLSGRLSAFTRTSISTTLDFCFHWKSISTFSDIHHFSSRQTSSLRTSISYPADIHKNRCGRPSAFIRTSVSI